MKVYYDIHIHSCLSACGDELQTPNNILNMAMLKELNMISVTDHNTLKHLATFNKIIESYNFLFLYGCEVTVKEGFHVLAYFNDLDTALSFDEILDKINIKKPYYSVDNRQIICDEYDLEKEEITYLLNYPLDLSCLDMIKKVKELNGIVVAAHVNRSKGILEVYKDLSGFDFDAIEIYKEDNNDLCINNSSLKKFPVLYNSDAHSLENINDCINYIELDELTFSGFKKYLENNHE